eukprot:TRINITY_DN1586_c0_g1_i1.p1 TRINITY_DN1586_c0_g1~~TRINITY_DN1586_c0_g1_i1.p1  ORF type:complete len:293 (-),score=109.15 TRINITY_DN1586_c0_g1_i1:1424-2302(-)
MFITRRAAIKYLPPKLLIEYETKKKGLRHRIIDIKIDNDESYLSAHDLTDELRKQHIFLQHTLDYEKNLKLVSKLCEEKLLKLNLNNLSTNKLNDVKSTMDVSFEENIIRPDDPSYVYDKRVTFEKPTQDNAWDEEETESEDENISTQKEEKQEEFDFEAELADMILDDMPKLDDDSENNLSDSMGSLDKNVENDGIEFDSNSDDDDNELDFGDLFNKRIEIDSKEPISDSESENTELLEEKPKAGTPKLKFSLPTNHFTASASDESSTSSSGENDSFELDDLSFDDLDDFI